MCLLGRWHCLPAWSANMLRGGQGAFQWLAAAANGLETIWWGASFGGLEVVVRPAVVQQALDRISRSVILQAWCVLLPDHTLLHWLSLEGRACCISWPQCSLFSGTCQASLKAHSATAAVHTSQSSQCCPDAGAAMASSASAFIHACVG
jgi:hypothetical protein